MSDDVLRAQSILQWAREFRFLVQRVKVGDVEIEGITDLSLIPSEPPSMATDRPSQDPYEQFGGKAMARLAQDEEREASGGSAVVDEDD